MEGWSGKTLFPRAVKVGTNHGKTAGGSVHGPLPLTVNRGR